MAVLFRLVVLCSCLAITLAAATAEDPTPAPKPAPNGASTLPPAPAPEPAPNDAPTLPPTPACTEGERKADTTDCKKYTECKNGAWKEDSCFWFRKFDSISKRCVMWGATCAKA
ncbi:uncharacterized protein [Halyomorpha halys]|uniref:uncharacterized protein n=1 Tax=Halyomorpha halys TaxID=286706 RepID=UPI0006D510B3|nr:myrosinase-binding protein 2-like [Halyomorpha halys]